MKLFLCYSSEDKEFVRNLEVALRYCHYQCWVDENEIMVGDSIRNKIAEALDSVDFIIPVLSSNSINSAFVNFIISSVIYHIASFCC